MTNSWEIAPQPNNRGFLSACEKFIEVIGISAIGLFSRRLGRGEQEVLKLALRERTDIVLLDDRKACNEAREQGLTVASARAVLKIAEEKHHIPDISKVEKILRAKNI